MLQSRASGLSHSNRLLNMVSDTTWIHTHFNLQTAKASQMTWSCPRTGSTEHNSKNSPCILIKTIVSCHCFPWNKSIQVCWSSTDSCWWLCNCNSATESRYNLFDMFCHKKRDTATWLRLEVPLPRTSTQRTWQRCTRRGKSWSHERVRAQAQAAQAHEALPKRQPKVGPSWKSCSLKI